MHDMYDISLVMMLPSFNVAIEPTDINIIYFLCQYLKMLNYEFEFTHLELCDPRVVQLLSFWELKEKVVSSIYFSQMGPGDAMTQATDECSGFRPAFEVIKQLDHMRRQRKEFVYIL